MNRGPLFIGSTVIPIDRKSMRDRARRWSAKQTDSSLVGLIILIGMICLLAGIAVGFCLGQVVKL